MVSKRQRSNASAAVPEEIVFSRERMNRASAEFLKIDIETALTFLMIARQTEDVPRRQRNLRAARHAYETVARLRSKIILNEEDSRRVTSGLGKLRSELEHFGETF